MDQTSGAEVLEATAFRKEEKNSRRFRATSRLFSKIEKEFLFQEPTQRVF